MRMFRLVLAGWLCFASAAWAQVGQIPSWPPLQHFTSAPALAIDGVGAHDSGPGDGTATLTMSTTSSNDVLIVDAGAIFCSIASVTSASLGSLALRVAMNTPGPEDIERWWIKTTGPLTNDTISVVATCGGGTVEASSYAFSGSSNPTSPWDVTSVTSASDPISITPASSNTVALFAFATNGSTPSPGTGLSSLATMQNASSLTEYKAVASPTSTSGTLTSGAGTAGAAIADVLH